VKQFNPSANNWWRPENNQAVTCAGILWR